MDTVLNRYGIENWFRYCFLCGEVDGSIIILVRRTINMKEVKLSSRELFLFSLIQVFSSAGVLLESRTPEFVLKYFVVHGVSGMVSLMYT